MMRTFGKPIVVPEFSAAPIQQVKRKPRRAERPNHVWSIDFIFDRTENDRSIKILSMIST